MQRTGLSWAPQGWPGQVARREGQGCHVEWGRQAQLIEKGGEATEFGKWDLWEVRW